MDGQVQKLSTCLKCYNVCAEIVAVWSLQTRIQQKLNWFIFLALITDQRFIELFNNQIYQVKSVPCACVGASTGCFILIWAKILLVLRLHYKINPISNLFLCYIEVFQWFWQWGMYIGNITDTHCWALITETWPFSLVTGLLCCFLLIMTLNKWLKLATINVFLINFNYLEGDILASYF